MGLWLRKVQVCKKKKKKSHVTSPDAFTTQWTRFLAVKYPPSWVGTMGLVLGEHSLAPVKDLTVWLYQLRACTRWTELMVCGHLAEEPGCGDLRVPHGWSIWLCWFVVSETYSIVFSPGPLSRQVQRATLAHRVDFTRLIYTCLAAGAVQTRQFASCILCPTEVLITCVTEGSIAACYSNCSNASRKMTLAYSHHMWGNVIKPHQSVIGCVCVHFLCTCMTGLSASSGEWSISSRHGYRPTVCSCVPEMRNWKENWLSAVRRTLPKVASFPYIQLQHKGCPKLLT